MNQEHPVRENASHHLGKLRNPREEVMNLYGILQYVNPKPGFLLIRPGFMNAELLVLPASDPEPMMLQVRPNWFCIETFGGPV